MYTDIASIVGRYRLPQAMPWIYALRVVAKMGVVKPAVLDTTKLGNPGNVVSKEITLPETTVRKLPPYGFCWPTQRGDTRGRNTAGTEAKMNCNNIL